MRFTLSSVPFKKLAGIAVAVMILPVAVSCTAEGDDVTVDATTKDMMAADGKTIVDVASANGSFDTLVAAVKAAGLTDVLSAEGPYTVFAPTDEAFAALPTGLVDKLLMPENKAVLAQILTYHVVGMEVPSSAVTTGMVPSVEGSDLDLVAADGSVMVNGANVIAPDVMTSNGVIHVIDAVLIPPSVDLAAL